MSSIEQILAIKAPRLLSESEAAEFLGMSSKWLSNQRWLGLGPSYLKIGRCIRYKVSELDAFLEHCEVCTDRQ
jgi:predicted DNA-binding transcriptional regulator AlpA